MMFVMTSTVEFTSFHQGWIFGSGRRVDVGKPGQGYLVRALRGLYGQRFSRTVPLCVAKRADWEEAPEGRAAAPSDAGRSRRTIGRYRSRPCSGTAGRAGSSPRNPRPAIHTP